MSDNQDKITLLLAKMDTLLQKHETISQEVADLKNEIQRLQRDVSVLPSLTGEKPEKQELLKPKETRSPKPAPFLFQKAVRAEGVETFPLQNGSREIHR